MNNKTLDYHLKKLDPAAETKRTENAPTAQRIRDLAREAKAARKRKPILWDVEDMFDNVPV
ncbi:hypothetical protein [Marivita sp. GX14005]|uniref:hypothetical protein n=1 Tax=Marivita sp. GX14005 TaxID=2942276 RepID=UPI00201893B9|nr:hypothetical protein [Marivita sp. GX14005]MCL3881295.1 hypothetical protein [Marivita sp. GX14005]